MKQHGSKTPDKYHRGFTLVELLIVMVVIGILASIAIPSYRQHVLKVKRIDAQTALTSWGQRLERCYTRYNRFNNFDVGDTQCTFAAFNTQDGTYAITLNATAQTFMLTATPLGAQMSDTRCGEMSLNEQGIQGATGTDGAAKCW